MATIALRQDRRVRQWMTVRDIQAPLWELYGAKDALGLWSSGNEGAKFWLAVMTELKTPGLRDVYVVCVNGLKGFSQAIESVFPQAQGQICIVHLIRSLPCVSAHR